MNTKSLVSLPVLSVQQPWASYIVGGLKSIELRTWATTYRGWLWIHASKRPDIDAMFIYKLEPGQFQTGGLIGIGLLANCEIIKSPEEWFTLRNEHRSPGSFHPGTYGWHFQDVIALQEKIDFRGELGLFRIDELRRAQVASDLEKSTVHSEFLQTTSHL